MYKPSRRDFFTCAVGATLTSALPISAESHGLSADKPLVLDLIGPMAFIMGTGVVDVWLPVFTHTHEAGIVTSAGIIPLDARENNISFERPSPASPPTPNIYLTNNCKVHSEQADKANLAKSIAKNEPMHLTLPMPNNIVALSGVAAYIYTPTAAQTPQPNCTPNKPCCTSYALGLRFLYNKAGAPTLTTNGGKAQTIPLDVAPFEDQVIMLISYDPVDQPDDTNDDNARATFNELAIFFGLNRAVEIAKCQKGTSQDRTPQHPCKAPIILVTLKN
jgi:hypothetical protein